MGSREEILRALREAAPPPAPPPDLAGRRGQVFADLAAQFALSLQEVGGRCVRTTEAALPDELRKLARSIEAKTIGSIVPQFPGIDLAAHSIPHTLAGVDLAVLPGELAGAGNGAVWITEAGVRHIRGPFFLSPPPPPGGPASPPLQHIHQAHQKGPLPPPG